MIVGSPQRRDTMATPSLGLDRVPARDTFYVVKQGNSMAATLMVTVLHEVPTGAYVLGVFDSPNRAIDFAEATVHELNRTGSTVELVDPPYGLVGAG
jgi:hypothetical protein